jgi:maleylacetate reductase
MNALAHAVEALYTPLANPVASMTALRGAHLIATGLARPEPVRADVALGALLAGYASGTTGIAFHHALCQTVVRTAGTPHAQTNAVILPHSVRFMLDRAPEEMARLGRTLGARSADGAPDAVARLSARTGVTTLRALGVRGDSLDAIADAAAAAPTVANTPRPPGAAELRELLVRALG